GYFGLCSMKGSMRISVPFGVVMRTVACPSHVMEVPLRSDMLCKSLRAISSHFSFVRCVSARMRGAASFGGATLDAEDKDAVAHSTEFHNARGRDNCETRRCN